MARQRQTIVPIGTAPMPKSLAALRKLAADCRACDLYKNATQTVFGEGPARASIMLVGEQPGDAEDLAGRPFVGPAGTLLSKALDEAGIARTDVYVTNAVKHFRWVARGKKRIHKKPNLLQIEACRPWLDAEIAQVRPVAVVALGATAAQAMFGASFRVTKQRGRPVETPLADLGWATLHPSSVLRAPDPVARKQAYAALVEDLRALKLSVARRRPRKAAG